MALLPKEPTSVTVAANEALLSAYPFHDTERFHDARRGLIAPLPNEGVVRHESGRVVWDLSKYTLFIGRDTPAPPTVNPSLWRQSQLLMISGLFEVVPGVYQIRGYDLSNMTVVELPSGDGIHIFDPLTSAETARAALELYYAHRPRVPIKSLFYTHSHADHFAGVRGVLQGGDVSSGKVRVYAPVGFMEHAVAENVMAGTAMSRRAYYMYGNALSPGPKGSIGAGLGVTLPTGTATLIPPTHIIKETGERHVIDGLEYVFLMAPGSEAPSEMYVIANQNAMVFLGPEGMTLLIFFHLGCGTCQRSKWSIQRKLRR
jgi:alkyl sulfatase BDS1-like metallo-beta-lactamase superfamily hydrolase